MHSRDLNIRDEAGTRKGAAMHGRDWNMRDEAGTRKGAAMHGRPLWWD